MSIRQSTVEVLGGVTSAMVMLPLALAYGVASGLGALAGLYGAVALGFIAAVSGGTRTMISGPTALMAVATTSIISNHDHNLTEVFTIIMLAGAMQIVLGATRVGRFIAYAPYSVVSGFMTGIGVIVIVLQTRPLLGLPIEGRGVLATIRSWTEDAQDVVWQAPVVALVAVVVLVAWPPSLHKYVPSVFAALVVGTAFGAVWLGDAPTIGAVPTGMPELHTPDLSPASLLRTVQPAVTIALIGSIDTLLTARIAESMSRQPHSPHRDLLGQGVGHVATGILGGLAGGATVCTVANIRAGARTRVSGALCALVLLALVGGLGHHVHWVPHAVLAAVLMQVGFDFVDWRMVRRLHQVQREHFIIMGVTLVLTVFFDLVTAVSFGFITAALAGMRQVERLEVNRIVSTPLLDNYLFGRDPEDCEQHKFSARTCLVALRGSFTVASSHRLTRTIGADIADYDIVVLDFSATDYIDDSAALVVEYLVEIAQGQGTELIVVDGGAAVEILHVLGILDMVQDERFVETKEEAFGVARELLGGFP